MYRYSFCPKLRCPPPPGRPRQFFEHHLQPSICKQDMAPAAAPCRMALILGMLGPSGWRVVLHGLDSRAARTQRPPGSPPAATQASCTGSLGLIPDRLPRGPAPPRWPAPLRAAYPTQSRLLAIATAPRSLAAWRACPVQGWGEMHASTAGGRGAAEQTQALLRRIHASKRIHASRGPRRS